MPPLFILEAPDHAVAGVYSPGLVLLSYGIAVVASYTAFVLTMRLKSLKGAGARYKTLLTVNGAFALGAGIWSMHFVGMLAFSQPMRMDYDIGLTVLSMAVAIAVAYAVIRITTRPHLPVYVLISAAVLLGGGICAMHYIGMAAMQMDGVIRYLPRPFALSVAVAVMASGLALWLLHRLTRAEQQRNLWIACSALIMGAGICGMHYTGMQASVFIPLADCRYDPDQSFLPLAIVVGTITLLVLVSAHFVQSFLALSVHHAISRRMLLQLSVLFTIVLLTNISAFFFTYFFVGYEKPYGMLSHYQRLVELIILAMHSALYVGILYYSYYHIIRPLARVTDDLEQSKAFMTHIINAIGEPLFVKDRSHRWIMGNRAFWSLLGRSEAEALLKTDHDFLPKEQSDAFWEGDEKAFRHGQLRVVEEIVNADGIVRMIDTNKTAFRINDEEYLVGVIRDVTEQWRIEQELAHHRLNLEQMVAEQTRDLVIAREEERAARQQAEQANQLKSVFLSNISHELRTPMHAIITFSRQGLERIERWSPGEQADNLRLIQESGQRLLGLLNDLLDLSKLEAKAMVYDFRDLDLAAPLQTALREIQGLADARQLRLRLEWPPDMPRIRGDFNKLVQLFMNLLSNAVKFTGPGKGIRIHAARSGNEVTLAVEDEGVGIPPEELETVFDKFIQSSKTRTGAGGTGLGLAISKEIVHAHGGTIWAENNAGEGATFYIRLPTVTN